MASEKCPKCGAKHAESVCGDAHYPCGTIVNGHHNGDPIGTVYESKGCLRRQLAAANERADRAEEIYHCGYAIHFCAGSRCAFHLGTIVNGWAVSTIGHYLPVGARDPEPLGAEEDSLFEMAICRCSGLDENLNAQLIGEWEILERFSDSRDAERAHHAKVEELEASDASD